jgi:amino acid adenylation domain-containing protein
MSVNGAMTAGQGAALPGARPARGAAAWWENAAGQSGEWTGEGLDIAGLIFAQAAATPEATALSVGGPATADAAATRPGDERVTYGEFARRAARLARYLHAVGVGPDVMVAVALDRSADQLVAALAVLAAGGAYVPFDPSYPPQRLSFMLDDAQAPVLITRSDMAKELRGGTATILLDHDADRIAAYPATPPRQVAGPGHLAYVIYTSGSTGRPKGAMNTRAGLLSRLQWMQQAYQLTPADAVLQKTPVGFDVSVWECYWALLAGARIVIAATDGHRDPDYLAALIAGHRVTIAHFVPAMLQIFLDTTDLTGCESLRQVVVSGEVLPADLQRRFYASGLHASLDNLYGPAEAAIDVTRWPCPPGWTEPSVPIGSPVPRTRTHVLDHRGNSVPVGAEGELYLGGIQVGRGYLRRAALTAERFIPDPYSATPGARLYRTGDRARLRPDGALDYLGRLDDQVKIRGVRLELGEIEAALTAHPAVRACAATVHGSGPTARLIAYVVTDGSAGDLRAQLARRLPDAMVPAVIIPLPALPLSANGKVDRRNLPDPGTPHPALPRDHIGEGGPPAGDGGGLEPALGRIWSEVLGIPAAGYHEEFTELGGTSLHAAQIRSRIRARFGAELSFRELFEARTISDLAILLSRYREAGLAGQPEPLLPPVRRAPGSDVVPSLSQQRLWFLDHLSSAAGVAYNLPAAARLRGPLNVPALQSAINDVIWRHEQLRTSFHLADGRLCAQVGDELPSVRIVDLSNCRDPEHEALRQAERLASEHIDLGKGPLLRCAVFRLGAEDHLMTVVFHHVVADGWSVSIFDRDLAEAYRARLADRPPAWPDFRIEYRDYAGWQRGLANSPALASTMDYWRGQLADAPTVLELPADHARPAVRSHRGRRVSRPAPAGLAEALRQLAAATRTTPHAVCLAAFGTLLRGLTGRQDFLVALPAAGRPDPALEEVAGFFANTTLVRLRPCDRTFRKLTEATHKTALDALEHQYVPFERLVAEFAPAGDLSRPPLAQVALAYQGPRRPYARLAGLTVQPEELGNGTAKFDLTMELHEVGEDLEVILEYCTDLFKPERADWMLGRFLDLLVTGTAKPDVGLAELAAAPAPDRCGARSRPGGPDQRCLHEIFAGIAARCPDRVAVTDGARSLSYAELDQAANRLAHRLQRLGAGPEQLVGVCAERTVDLIIGVLAVLKSGAGYLPLDPGYPTARLDLILADADCHILLGDDLCATLACPGRVLVRLGDPLGDKPDEPPSTAVRAENAAYVIYTSGSTGTPKGVVVTHDNVTRLFIATEDEFGPGPDDVWTLFHSLTFDFSVWEIWGALLHGGRLVVVSHRTSREPIAFLDLLRAERVTVLSQTPTAFRQLMAAAEDAGFPALEVRVVVFGGEALDPATLRSWVGGYGTARPRLVNMYGITETTVHVTIREIAVTDLACPASPIGKPIEDLRVHVLDDDMAELPAGTEGEMYVGGPGVSRGYLSRPALSAQRFVPDPFGGSGERLYRTGDLAVRRPDGELEFRGRADAQVKLHGFRIELGEIERALFDQPSVRAAACVLREDTPGRPRLAAYLVLASGQALRPEQIRAALLDRLPEHMVPAVFVEVPALPLSSNGKLDWARLPAPPRHDARTRCGPRVRACTATERTLASVWSEVLDIDEPDVHDNFFTLGGDSIVAIRIGAAARTAGLPVTVEQVFLHPTIAQLAAECARGQPGPARPAVAGPSTSLHYLDPADLPPDVIDAYPMAAMQLGILFDCGMADDSGLYHDLISVHLAARFDRAALQRALATVCARHEILRTSFSVARFREPLQLVHRAATVPITVEERPGGERPGRALDATTHEAALDEGLSDALAQWWRREEGTPFDLSDPPLVRCHVLLRSPQAFQLSVSVHHILLDGWSLAQLMTEVLLDYDAQLGGTSAALAPMPSARYRDFIVAEQAAAAEPAAAQFWGKANSAAAEAPLPVLPGADTSGDLAFEATLPAELDAELRRVAGELGIPVKSAFFAAHLWALREITDRAAVVSGLQVNGRLDQEGADRLLGLFLNIVPLHLTVDHGTWAELARAAFTAEREIQPFRRYPLAKMQRMAGRSRILSGAVFNYTDFHVFDELDRLARIRPVDWWDADRHSFRLMTEISSSRNSGRRMLKVTTGADRSMAGTGSRLGELALQAMHRIAENPHQVLPSVSAKKR